MARSPETIEALVATFRDYLEQTQTDPEAHEPPPAPDLFSLFSELEGLRTEVKRESRQVKEATDGFKPLLETAQNQQEQLNRAQSERTAEAAQQAWQAQTELLRRLLDLYDRLADAERLQPPEAPAWSWGCRPHRAWISAVREGQALSRRALERLLGDYGVSRLETHGQPFDPRRMRAVEVEGKHGSGRVIEEFRAGFIRDDHIVRPAEVKVRRQAPHD